MCRLAKAIRIVESWLSPQNAAAYSYFGLGDSLLLALRLTLNSSVVMYFHTTLIYAFMTMIHSVWSNQATSKSFDLGLDTHGVIADQLCFLYNYVRLWNRVWISGISTFLFLWHNVVDNIRNRKVFAVKCRKLKFSIMSWSWKAG